MGYILGYTTHFGVHVLKINHMQFIQIMTIFGSKDTHFHSIFYFYSKELYRFSPILDPYLEVEIQPNNQLKRDKNKSRLLIDTCIYFLNN